MRVEASCVTCHKQINKEMVERGEGVRVTESERLQVPMTTSPVAVLRCQQNHETLYMVQDGPYAMLYERALRRLVLNEPRDAVIDAYTAFEMFLSHVPVRARYDREAAGKPSIAAGGRIQQYREDLAEGFELWRVW